MRSGCSGGNIFWVLLLLGWFCVSKTIIPEARSTFLPFQHAATITLSVDWGFGVSPTRFPGYFANQ